MSQHVTLRSFQWCLRARAMCSEGPPACDHQQLTTMALGAEKSETQGSDDIVERNFPKQGVTWMTRPKTAILEEMRGRLWKMKTEITLALINIQQITSKI